MLDVPGHGGDFPPERRTLYGEQCTSQLNAFAHAEQSKYEAPLSWSSFDRLRLRFNREGTHMKVKRSNMSLSRSMTWRIHENDGRHAGIEMEYEEQIGSTRLAMYPVGETYRNC